MTAADRRRELAAFLRSRRQRVDPRSYGLKAGRRRVLGLRREELAALAGLSVTWYTWLEQARDIRASPEVLESVARALRLNAAETEYLLRLGGHTPPPPGPSGDDSSSDPLLRALLDSFLPHPASIVRPSFDFVNWNRASERIAPDFLSGSGDRQPNLLRYHFGAEAETGEDGLDSLVARLRGNAARHPEDLEVADVVEELSDTSTAFARLWRRYEVALAAPLPRIRKNHPELGELVFTQVQLAAHRYPDLTLIVSLPASEATAGPLDELAG